MQQYGLASGYENISKIKNSLKIIIDTMFENYTTDKSTFLNYDSFSIVFSSSADFLNKKVDIITNNQPYIDFASCVNHLQPKNNNNNIILVAQIIFFPDLMSNITQGEISTFAVFGSIYDFTNKISLNLQECNLEVYFPDPGYHGLSDAKLSMLYPMNINFYDTKDPFYNDRCVQFLDKTKGIDITLNERRNNYISQVNLNCVNYDYTTLNDLNDCILTGTTENGYVRCTCQANFSEITLFPIDRTTELNEISGINLDIMGCPVIWKYHNQPGKNAGMIFSIIFLTLFVTLSILMIFVYNDNYLINRHSITLNHNDCIKHSILIIKPEDIERNKTINIQIHTDRPVPNKIESNNYISANVMPKEKEFNTKLDNSPTIRDYYNFSNEEKLIKDNRSFLKYFWDQLSNTHIVILFIYKKSLLTSPLIRMFLFAFYLAMLFVLNAMFYTDDYIDKRANNYIENYWSYVWKIELIKSFLVCILTISPVTLMHLLVSPFNSLKILNSGYLKGDTASLKEENINYEKSMLLRYIIFIILCCLLIGFSLFYITVFSGVYYFSQLGWLYGGIASFIIDVFGIMIILPFIGALFRNIAQNLKFMNWLIIWTKVDEWNFYFHN